MIVLRDLASMRAEDVAGSREAVVAIGEGEVSGEAAAVLLFADYAVLVEDRQSCLSLATGQAGLPVLHAALVWRLGFDAYRLLLEGRTRFTAVEAVEAGLVDATEWKFENRSSVAFDTAAQLIARRGGDTLERAAFAHLFASGEPQEGLKAFLEKRRPGFRVA